jgi:small subunit ribosomal protein S6
MLILNPEAEEERHEDLLARTQQLILDGGGTVDHVNRWGRRKIAYPMEKQGDGIYVVITCTAAAQTLDEMSRIFSISKDVVLRALPIKLNSAQAERAKAHGSPVPADDRPDEPRSPRGGGRGGDRGDRGARRRSY